jgi:hypothetical protein
VSSRPAWATQRDLAKKERKTKEVVIKERGSDPPYRRDPEDTVLSERSRHTNTQPVTPLIGHVQNRRIQGQEVVDSWARGWSGDGEMGDEC